MIPIAFTLSLLGIAAASPLVGRQSSDHGPRFPQQSTSKGFYLVVNVTDPSRDFTPSIQNNYINSIHVGAGLALVGAGSAANNPRVFYQNGTASEVHYRQGTVISDGGLPPAPYGVSLPAGEGSGEVSTVHLNGGPGTKGIGLTRVPEPYAFLYPETYAVCNESVAYYRGKHFLILKHIKTTPRPDGTVEHNVPKECAPVRLFPECTELNKLPSGAISSHEFAQESGCYNNVSSIDWKTYIF
ncbi:hypothetical protein TOPH_08207 [Tolypocladium ophioglossoides CBS 100239]|uniref:DUF7907 domain-containing protein n=1 Tax=Tolypocladium ophioglossoides (strain CBS 100239) TaxID=1163406 RepID=A0A0L0MZF7_TOLOC|nr:hypothetical protein TOPH_08207 [Tolypocladium ophioglossoides CBS 100239]